MASTPSGQPDRTKPTTTRKLRRRARKLPPALAPDTEASEEEKEAERTRYRSLAVHQHRSEREEPKKKKTEMGEGGYVWCLVGEK
uniref:Uncharacterized protein n=1 Tax=Fagus sylvatica TaxID=28930 RepID=A0A2N9F5R8_FAGSY